MPNPRLSRGERHAQLVNAAAAAFLEGGYDGTSMEAVAERAGVTRLIVYRHFDGKERLYRAVLESVVAPLRDRFDPDQPAGFEHMLLDVARAHPDAFRLLWRHARHEPLFSKEATAFRQIAAGLAEQIIGRHIVDSAIRQWGAATLVDYLYGGICEWLDQGTAGGDAVFADHLRAGGRALVAAWSVA